MAEVGTGLPVGRGMYIRGAGCKAAKGPPSAVVLYLGGLDEVVGDGA